jgi:uncharacterized protein (DUF1330 family)
MRALSIVARAVSPTRAATSTRFAAATILQPIADTGSPAIDASSAGAEPVGRDNGEPGRQGCPAALAWPLGRTRALTVGTEDEMVAYWVARSKVNDPDQYRKYTDLVPGILEKFGGRILARGRKFQILEGTQKFHRFVVIEFPSIEKAVGCHDSPEYREAATHRKKDGASELEIVIVESL